MHRVRTSLAKAAAVIRNQQQARSFHSTTRFFVWRQSKYASINSIKELYDKAQQQRDSRDPDEAALPEDPDVVRLPERDKQTARKKTRILELPEIVLDLDAEDSPYVRPFDTKQDGLAQRLKWAVDPLLDELKEQALLHQRSFDAEAHAMAQAANRPLAPHAISDHDVLTVALLGAQVPPGTRTYEALRAHGVPQTTLDRGASETIPFMLHRQQLAAQRLTEDANKDDGTVTASFKAEVYQCKDLPTLRNIFPRVVSPASDNYLGLHALGLIGKQCVKLYPPHDLEERPSSRPGHDRLLDFPKFVNNVVLGQLLRNRDVHPDMALFGLQLASRHSILPALLQHLQICLSMGFINESTKTHPAVSRKVAGDILTILQQTDTVAVGTRQQLLRLLFGVDPGRPRPPPSLLGLKVDLDRRQNPERHWLRLQLLGQLGALRLLWRCGAESDEEEVLVDAFHRFAQLTLGVKGVDITTTTANDDDMANDAVLDLQTMGALDAHRMRVGRDNNDTISDPSSVPWSVSERLSSQDILAAFREKDISDAMRRFRELMP